MNRAANCLRGGADLFGRAHVHIRDAAGVHERKTGACDNHEEQEKDGLFNEGRGGKPEALNSKRKDHHSAGADLVLDALGRGKAGDFSEYGGGKHRAHQGSSPAEVLDV